MFHPVLPTPAIKMIDELLKVKGADGWGVVNRRGGSLATRRVVNGSVANGRVNDSFALFLVLGDN